MKVAFGITASAKRAKRERLVRIRGGEDGGGREGDGEGKVIEVPGKARVKT